MNELPKATFVFDYHSVEKILREGSILPARGDRVTYTDDRGVTFHKKVREVHVNVDSGDITYYVEEP